MRQTFEAEFGDFKLAARQASITPSPTIENEFFVLLFDLEFDIRRFFASPPFPKGKVCVREYVQVPTCCPNCDYELTGSKLIESDRFEYDGVAVEVVPSYNEDIMELKLHYERLL